MLSSSWLSLGISTHLGTAGHGREAAQHPATSPETCPPQTPSQPFPTSHGDAQLLFLLPGLVGGVARVGPGVRLGDAGENQLLCLLVHPAGGGDALLVPLPPDLGLGHAPRRGAGHAVPLVRRQHLRGEGGHFFDLWEERQTAGLKQGSVAVPHPHPRGPKSPGGTGQLWDSLPAPGPHLPGAEWP